MVAAIVNAAGPVDQYILVPFATSEETRTLLDAVDVPVQSFGCRQPADLPTTWLEVRRAIQALAPDVVHAHLFHAAVLVAALRRVGSFQTVLTHHHGSVLTDQGRRFEAILDQWAGRRYDCVVAVSDAVASFLKDSYRYPTELLEIIPNGWMGSPRPRSPTGPDFVAVGNLRREKGHAVLLRAFVLVRRRLADSRLRLVGDGPLRANLETLARELGIDDAVEFVGSVSDVWPHLAEAGIVVVPSLSETQGLVVLEAMAAGCPLIATDVGGIPEMIEDGFNGRLVPPGDIDALASAMVDLHGATELRQRYAEAGRATAMKWRMEGTVAQYLALYHRLGVGATG